MMGKNAVRRTDGSFLYRLGSKHMMIPLYDLYYKSKWDPFHKQKYMPHWIIKRGNRKKVAIYFKTKDSSNGIAADSKRIMQLKFWCKNKGFELYVYYDPFHENPTIQENRNLWDRLFRQKISTDEILSGEYDVLAFHCAFIPQEQDARDIISGEGLGINEHFINIHKYGKDILVLQDAIKNRADEFWNQYGLSNRKVLGVIMREEFSFINHMKGKIDKSLEKWRDIYMVHPHIPDPRDLVGIVREQMKTWGCDSVFVSTMYSDTISLFRDQIGKDNVFYIDRKRLDFEHTINRLTDFFDAGISEEDYIEKTSKYIEEMYLVSKCDSFLSAACGAPFIVACLKEGRFENAAYLPNTTLEDGAKII